MSEIAMIHQSRVQERPICDGQHIALSIRSLRSTLLSSLMGVFDRCSASLERFPHLGVKPSKA